MVIRLKEMTVPVHCHLQAAMAGEGLHRLGAEVGLAKNDVSGIRGDPVVTRRGCRNG
jgi:hypothetical protein